MGEELWPKGSCCAWRTCTTWKTCLRMTSRRWQSLALAGLATHIRHPSAQSTVLERAAEHALGLKEVVVAQVSRYSAKNTPPTGGLEQSLG